jgi:hypothetical protein
MKQVTLIEFSDGNLTGYEWSWKFILTKRKDRSYSLSAKQTTSDPPGMKIPHRHPLRSGEEIFKSLDGMLSEAGYGFPDDEIDTVTSRIARLSKVVAREFSEAAI